MFLFGPVAFLVILYAWATASFPALARRRVWVAAALAALWATQLYAHWLVSNDRPSTVPRAVVEMVLLPLVFAAFPIGLLRLGSWAVGRIAARRRANAAAPEKGMSRRQVVEATGGSPFWPRPDR